MARIIELRRHTANEGDVLTEEGVADAVRIGRALAGTYELFVSTGAQRSTQAAGCFLAGMANVVRGGVVVDEGFRSQDEDRWRSIYARTKRGDVEAFLLADYTFVEAEAHRFVEALRRVTAHTPEGGRSLVVGHSPMLEATVWAATGQTIPALGKGACVVLTYADGVYSIAL